MAEDKRIIDLTVKSTLSAVEAPNTFFGVSIYGTDFRISALTLNPYIGEALSVNGVYSDILLTIVGTAPRQCHIFSSGGDISYQINGVGYTITNNTNVNVPDSTKNYTITLTTSNTMVAIEDDDLLMNDAYDYIPIGYVTKGQVEVSFGQQDLINADKLQIDANYWAFFVTSPSIDIRLASRLNFQEGRTIAVIIEANQTIIHNDTIDGDDIPFLLSKGSDFTATKKNRIIICSSRQ